MTELGVVRRKVSAPSAPPSTRSAPRGPSPLRIVGLLKLIQ